MLNKNKRSRGEPTSTGSMWDAARDGKASNGDFSELEISPAFKPIAPEGKAKPDDYEVAMTGPASFMSPAPKKPLRKAASNPSIAELAASVDSAEDEDEASRSKLPIFAAVAASLACVAVLGVQNWPTATASTSPTAPSAGYAISAQQPAAPAIAVGGLAVSDAVGYQATAAMPARPAEPSAIGNFGTPGITAAQTQVAMAAPRADEQSFQAVAVAQPLAVVEEDQAPIRQAEFIPLKSGISRTADKLESLSRLDCAARFDTVQRSGAINFESGSATLLRSSQPILHFFANVFEHCQEFTIAVAGHTDATGNANYNQALSQKRAASVAKYLTKIGVPGERLRVIGYGESKPIASNDTALKRSRNRRIEFSIYDG